jgi:predicted nucleotidyltransferase
MPNRSSIEMIEIVAHGLDDLVNEVVFVGGAVTLLYYQDTASTRIRPTVDVDCVVKIASRAHYYAMEDELRRRRFRNDMRIGAPMCRWIYEDVTVDVMPAGEDILGFSNRWYVEGIERAIPATLPSGREIRIFSLPYFVASKIEAFNSRGGGDFRFSHDIEDVVAVLDARLDFDAIRNAPVTVKDYLKNEFMRMAADEQFLESVSGYLGSAPTSGARARRIIDFMNNYTDA